MPGERKLEMKLREKNTRCSEDRRFRGNGCDQNKQKKFDKNQWGKTYNVYTVILKKLTHGGKGRRTGGL